MIINTDFFEKLATQMYTVENLQNNFFQTHHNLARMASYYFKRNADIGRMDRLSQKSFGNDEAPSAEWYQAYAKKILKACYNDYQTYHHLKTNNNQAWANLCKVLKSRLGRYMRNRQQDSQNVDDFVQTSYIHIFNKLHLYPFDVPFMAWATRVAMNKVMEDSRGQHPIIVSLDTEQSKVRNLNTNEDFLTRCAEEDLKRAVYQALKTLKPATQQYVLEAYYLQGQCFEEIAHSLNKSTGAVHTLKCRGLKKLQDVLNSSHSNLLL